MASSIASARRYAQAILELALEQNDLDTWRHDLNVLAQVWSDPQMRAVLDDVRISKQKRSDRARQQLDMFISPLAMNMVLLLLSRGRTNLIPYISRQFEELERLRERKLVAQVTSALPLTEEQRTALRAQLAQRTGREVSLEERVDPEILGGLVIKVGDQLLDLSVAATLRRLRDQLVS